MKRPPNYNLFRLLLAAGSGLTLLSLSLNVMSFWIFEQKFDKLLLIQIYVLDFLGMLFVLRFVLTRIRYSEGYFATATKSVFVDLVNKRDPRWAVWLSRGLVAYFLILGLAAFSFGFFGGGSDR